jgi:hypothetical protein
MEKLPDIEKMSNTRERLLSLEKERRFVFHGSAHRVEILEPRQPYMNKNEKHGNPRVATSPFADIAIFRAIVNDSNFPLKTHVSSFSFDSDKGVGLYASQDILNNINNKQGFVYVLDKSLFKKFSGMEWRSEQAVEPIEVILVTAQDLSENIQSLDKDSNLFKK